MNVSTDKPETTVGRGIDVVKWLLVFALLAAAVVGNAYYAEQPLLYRVIAGVVLVVAAAFVALTTVKGQAFNAYRREAMIELRKIVWPTRQERMQTTLVVFVVVAIMAVLLWAFDWAVGAIISNFIG